MISVGFQQIAATLVESLTQREINRRTELQMMSGLRLIINRLTLIVVAVTVALASANAASEADHEKR